MIFRLLEHPVPAEYVSPDTSQLYLNESQTGGRLGINNSREKPSKNHSHVCQSLYFSVIQPPFLSTPLEPDTINPETMDSEQPRLPYHGIDVVRLEEVDLPVSQLKTENPAIGRFSAGFIVVRPNSANPSKLEVLLILRAYGGSWPETWEPPQGGNEEKDKTIRDTALRETEEEAGLIIRPENIFPLAYRRAFEHKGSQMISYQLIAMVDRKADITLSDEHLAWGFFGEEEVEQFGLFDKEKIQQDQHVMLEGKQEMLHHFFANEESLRKGELEAIVSVKTQ